MIIFFICLIVYVLLYCVSCIVVVKTEEAAVVERLGQYHKLLGAGFHFVFKPIDTIRPIVKIDKVRAINGKIYTTQIYSKIIDLRETIYDFPLEKVLTKDNVEINKNVILHFKIIEPRLAVYKVENFPEAIIKTSQRYITEYLKEHNYDEIYAQNLLADYDLKSILVSQIAKLGVSIECVELEDIKV